MIRSYRFRLFPTEEQKVLLNKHFGCSRFVYNWALDYNTRQYAQAKKHLGWMTIVSSGAFKQLKLNNPWLNEVSAASLQNSIGHLDKAFQNFFRNKKGFPKFKSKYDSRQSYEIPADWQIDFKTKKVKLPKFRLEKMKGIDNRIKFVLSQKVAKGKFGTATVSRNPSGQYFISFVVHTEEPVPEQIQDKDISKENSVGIDFGLKHFLTFSDGKKIDSPEYLKKSLDKLAWEQRKLSRKQNGSKNREKQRRKVARVYQRISDQRNDFLHKLTAKLVVESQYDCFCLEDLNLKGMMKRWGRKVSDLSYYEFTRQLTYKAVWHGKRVMKIGRFEPSTQICSRCGHRQKMGLDQRVYSCPECGSEMDRDVNAAVNIRNFVLRNANQNFKSTGASPGINDCGDGSSDLD